MLQLRPNCECCNKDLPPDADAVICSFERTFCPGCTCDSLAGVCSNCGDMTNARLDQEERELLDAYEAGGFVSDITEERKEQLSSAARAAFKEDKWMNIRISSRDLEALQRRALEEGLPYQSLVSSVLHKYVSGGLEDVVANKLTRRPRDARG